MPINDALKDYFWSPYQPAVSGQHDMGTDVLILASPLDPVAFRIDAINVFAKVGTPDYWASATVYLGNPPSNGGSGTPFLTASAQNNYYVLGGIPTPLVSGAASATNESPFYVRYDGGEDEPDYSFWLHTEGETTFGTSFGGAVIFYSFAYLF